jgi:CO dehydrogenase/acetyl-CoA synthase gamma subunit (corrinoid Fe-S protein)
MDAFKRETMIGFTCWDINAKCVHNRNRAKDAHMVKRSARRKNREKLKKLLTDPQIYVIMITSNEEREEM